ncbi:MAG: hypothetical protein RR440_00330 [Erysipelotrichaceae bacterium]
MTYTTRQRLRRFNHYNQDANEAEVNEQPEVVEADKQSKVKPKTSKKVAGEE